MGGDPDVVEALARGESVAGVDDRTRRVLAFALRLTRRPHDMEAADVQALRDVGLSDAAVHDVATVCAYFNFVNRVAQGLGVELEVASGSAEGSADGQSNGQSNGKS